MTAYKKFGFIANDSEPAQNVASILKTYYGIEEFKPDIIYEVIIIVGGDGFMLRSLHKYLKLNTPFFGINCGEVGFLLNQPNLENLVERIEKSYLFTFYPLEVKIKCLDGSYTRMMCINDISILRHSSQASSLRIEVGGYNIINKLIGDGMLISTPLGSSAYNYSAGGPIIMPTCNNITAFTPLNSYSPKRMGSFILERANPLRVTILEGVKRPITLTTDYMHFSNSAQIEYIQTLDTLPFKMQLLFDAPYALYDKITQQYFS